MTTVLPAQRTGEVRAGLRDMVPLALAVTPQGLTLGVAMSQLPTDRRTAWATSALMYSASAQLAMLTTYAGGAAAAAVVVALVVNARLLLYSAALAPHWRGRPLWWRLLAGALIIDPSFVHAQDRLARPGSARGRARHHLAGALLLFGWWQVVTGVGVLAPSVVPDLGFLSAAAPLCFVAMLATGVKDRRAAVAAGTALAASVALAGLPLGAGLGLAIVLGLAAVALLDRTGLDR